MAFRAVFLRNISNSSNVIFSNLLFISLHLLLFQELLTCSVDYEEIDSVEIPEDYDYDNGYHKVNGSDFCLTLPFTYDEIGALAHAVENALQFVKECSDDPSCTKEDIADMKNAAIRWRNLQAKFAKFHKRFRKS